MISSTADFLQSLPSSFAASDSDSSSICARCKGAGYYFTEGGFLGKTLAECNCKQHDNAD